MNISLPPELEKIILAKLADGEFNSPGEVVAYALRHLNDRSDAKLWSYTQHSDQEKELSTTGDLPSCFERASSIDAWRHRRMLETLRLLIQAFPNAKWLTIGDGKFGSDAYFLQTQGVDVIASSISTHTLEVAHAKGYIKQYRAENAEALSLADNTVDFVLCKESYHHFPKPPQAFYEMFRVARKAVVLIEPIDSSAYPLTIVKSLAKRILRGESSEEFEESGNYLYRLSIREIFKLLAGIGYGELAWKGLNDFYIPRCGAAESDALSMSSVGTRVGIGVQNLLSRLKLLNYGLASLICFKEKAPQDLLLQLKRNDFVVKKAPVNPFLLKTSEKVLSKSISEPGIES